MGAMGPAGIAIAPMGRSYKKRLAVQAALYGSLAY